jgi:hypothetical protein
VTGPEADALAHAMERAVHKEDWDRTGAVRWTFHAVGLTHKLAWDKQRNMVQVRWKKNLVHLDVAHKSGRAWTDGVEQLGAKRARLVDDSLKLFFNDSFWLNPVVKLFDDGVTRTKVLVGGKPALLVSYASGGVTPGDKYLWLLDENDRPVAWRMWVQVFRVPGVQVSWEGWTPLPTGALIASRHRFLGLTGVRMDDLEAAPSWDQLPKEP